MSADRAAAFHPRSVARTTAALLTAGLFVLLFAAGLLTLSQDGHPLSIVDEHIHFDTAVLATEGQIPYRGTVLGQALVQEWACGVGHEAGPTTLPCGDPGLDADAIPSGKYSTGYIHYPTYFFAAAAFEDVWTAVTGATDPLAAFRAFSAVTMIAGVLVCAAFAWALGLRGSRLIAATSLPVASSMIVLLGTVVNPASTAVLTGGLVAGTGLLWVRRGRGFVWFALAVGLSSAIAVTSTLPAGGFLLAMAAVLISRRVRAGLGGPWNPRWWHVVVIAALVVLPVWAWGRVIAARATIGNDVLYGFLPPSGPAELAVGVTRELALLHTPWLETMGIEARPDVLVAEIVHAFSTGAPIWITALVFGGLVAVLVQARRGVDAARHDGEALMTPRLSATRSSDGDAALRLVALGMLAAAVLYPPALRVSNWLNFGFDFPIVDRYSIAFAAPLAFLLLLLIRRPAFTRPLAAIGVLTALGAVAGAI